MLALLKKFVKRAQRTRNATVPTVQRVNGAKQDTPLKQTGKFEKATSGRAMGNQANPWSFLQTYGVVDANNITERVAQDYKKYGIIKAKNLFSNEEIEYYLKHVQNITKLQDKDFEDVLAKRKRPYISPGTVTRHRELWPIVYHPRLLQVVRTILGQKACFYGSDSVFVHNSSIGLHRDGQYHESEGPLNLTNDAHNLLRIIIYLNLPGRPSERLGFVPFSHQKKELAAVLKDLGWESRQDELAQQALWLDLAPDDAVLFDGRVLHSGDALDSPKYAIVLTYCLESEPIVELSFKNRIVRGDEGYDDYTPEFKAKLDEHGIKLQCLDDEELYRHYEQKYAAEREARQKMPRANLAYKKGQYD